MLFGTCVGYHTDGNAATGRLNGRIAVALANRGTRKGLPICGFFQFGLRLGTICARSIGTDVPDDLQFLQIGNTRMR